MTIKEVAQLAGVSSAAVSRYLNGGPLSKEKKEKIARAIQETGFRPNLVAKTMRTGKVRQVGIILPRIFSESVNQVMEGIAGELLHRDYLTLLGYSDTRMDREVQYLDLLQSNSVAGIILMGTTLSDIKKLSLASCTLPLVITGQKFDGLNCVYSDDKNGVREMTERMIKKGRRHFVYIGVLEEDRAAGFGRREGMQEALREAGIDADNVPRRIADFTAESGYEAMMDLLEECPDLDAVMCATDVIAHGAMKALKEKGRRIPGDVSVAGVGDNWADQMSDPMLSTVKLQQRRCGQEAARMLLRMLGEEAGTDDGADGAPGTGRGDAGQGAGFDVRPGVGLDARPGAGFDARPGSGLGAGSSTGVERTIYGSNNGASGVSGGAEHIMLGYTIIERGSI